MSPRSLQAIPRRCAVAFAEEPNAVYKQGTVKLRDAQSDHSVLVPAKKLLCGRLEGKS